MVQAIQSDQNDNLGDRSNQNPPDFVLDWFEIFHPWDFISAEATKGKPEWITISKYPLNPEKLYFRWHCPNELVGVRFRTGRKGVTRYLMIDIDIGSAYHPHKDLEAFACLLEAMESIGLCRHLKVRSSNSNGLHIYFPLPEPLSCYSVALVANYTVQKAGFEVKPGQLELFPNFKTNKSLYNAHRLPLQVGSWVLDDDFQPAHQCLVQFIKSWYAAAQCQDIDALNHAIVSAKPLRRNNSGDATEWRERLEKVIQKGWTGEGQTNGIVRDVCIYARVFESKEWNGVENWAISTLISLPGYERFCNHKRDIRRRVKDWIKTNRKSNRYQPYGTLSKKPKAPKAPSNAERSAAALQRIKDAIAQIIAKSGQLPQGVRVRQELICKIANCSATTLRKHLEIWHPDYDGRGCVIVYQKGVTAISEERLGLISDNENQGGQQRRCVTVDSIKVSTISDANPDITGSNKTQLEQDVTHPLLLSVLSQASSDQSLYSKDRLEKESFQVSFSKFRSVEQGSADELKSYDSALRPQIAVNSTVKRKSDGALFRVRSLNSNGTAWLKWINQPVPLVDVVLQLSEVEPVALEKIA